MKRYDRTWPLSFAAIALGTAIGWSLIGPDGLLWPDTTVDTYALNAKAGRPAVEELPEVEVPAELTSAEAESTDPLLEPATIPVIELSDLQLEVVLDVLRSSDNVRDRRNAAIFLGSADPGRVLGAMMVALRMDAAPEVRFAVAESLGRLGSPVTLGSLHVAIVHDDDLRVREAAAAALSKVGDDSSIPVLEHVVRTDASKDVRDQAALSLGWLKYGAPAAMKRGLAGR